MECGSDSDGWPVGSLPACFAFRLSIILYHYLSIPNTNTICLTQTLTHTRPSTTLTSTETIKVCHFPYLFYISYWWRIIKYRMSSANISLRHWIQTTHSETWMDPLQNKNARTHAHSHRRMHTHVGFISVVILHFNHHGDRENVMPGIDISTAQDAGLTRRWEDEGLLLLLHADNTVTNAASLPCLTQKDQFKDKLKICFCRGVSSITHDCFISYH